MNNNYDEITNILDLVKFSGTICISKEGEIIYEKAMGKADYEREIANQMNTTFFVASVTKQFTAASILLLNERGKLNLDDTIDRYIPFYSQADKITIRHLLNMTSGIADYLNDVIDMQYREEEKASDLSPSEFFLYAVDGMNQKYTFEDVMKLICDLPLMYRAGCKLRYSNTNYQLLGYIIEYVSGQSYEEFVKQNIFEPLQMNSSHMNGIMADANSYVNANMNYRALGKSKSCGADGNIVSNAYDMNKWLQAVINGELLNSKSWTQCFTFIENSDKDLFPNNYGFGWMRSDKWYIHGGCQLGYLAGVAIHPEDKISIVLLGNTCSEDYEEEPLFKIINLFRKCMK